MRRPVIVANPGGQRHLRDEAAAFAEVGELEAYVSTFGFGPDEIERICARLPGPVAQRVRSELKRREVTPDVASVAMRRATLHEIAFIPISRSPLPERVRIALLRQKFAAFERAVGRILSSSTAAVISYQGASAAIFSRAHELGVATVLDYPIAHFEFAERVLSEEARLVPEFAATMRVTTYPEWVKRKYEQEIAIADRIIMVCERQRETFAEAGVDPERTFIVPWFVDSELFTPADGAPDRFRVAFVGQLSQRKGLSYLIEGFRRAQLPGSELLLIGRTVGTARPWEGVPGVRHVQAVPHFALPDVLRTCSVVSLPSLVEGFPVSVLEGMACGLPAIISENIGHDIVEDGDDGYVIPIRDPDAIAERLRELHGSPALLEGMSNAARAKAETFTRERHHEAMRGGVAALLESRRPAAPHSRGG